MAGKDFYGLLGVSPTENTEEIRKAWIRISRVIHPDRFDPQKQKEDWQQANRMLSEVNEAWQTLKDPKKRELYDIQNGFASPKSAFSYDEFSSAAESTPPPRESRSYDYGPDPTLELKSGQSPFHKLPDTLQKKLLDRQRGDDEDQYYINTDQSAHHYLKAGFILLWVAILAFSAMGREWSGTITLLLFAGTVFATLLFSKHLLWLIKWHQSPLLSRLYVTPMYIIETHHGFVRWWPVTGIEDIRITSGNTYLPGRNTTLNLKYSGESVRLSIAPIQLARNCVGMIQQYRSAIDQALWSYDYDYVRDRNDFRNAETNPPHRSPKTGYFSFGIPALVMAILFGFLFMENRGNQPQIGNRIISQMLPHNGSQVSYFEGQARAPLELHAERHRHFLVRVTHKQSGLPVKTVFVRSGNSVNTRLPDGEFLISYAAGNYWYGPNDIFGPRGTFYEDTRTYQFDSSDNVLSGHLIQLADTAALARGDIITIDAEQFQAKTRY